MQKGVRSGARVTSSPNDAFRTTNHSSLMSVFIALCC